jgi:hypothetical protein
MSISSRKGPVRAEAAHETKQTTEVENRIEAKLRRWRFAALISGVAFLASVTGVFPFLDGHALHHRWEPIGKNLLLLSMGLLLVFAFTGELSYVIWDYLMNMRAINRKYAPPKFKS